MVLIDLQYKKVWANKVKKLNSTFNKDNFKYYAIKQIDTKKPLKKHKNHQFTEN